MQTKLEAIIKGLSDEIGLVVVPSGAGYIAVKKSRQNCKHRDTNHTRVCSDGVNVPCPEWSYDTPIETMLVKCDIAGSVQACVNCNHGSNHVSLNGCAAETYDYCKHIERTVKCVPVKRLVGCTHSQPACERCLPRHRGGR